MACHPQSCVICPSLPPSLSRGQPAAALSSVSKPALSWAEWGPMDVPCPQGGRMSMPSCSDSRHGRAAESRPPRSCAGSCVGDRHLPHSRLGGATKGPGRFPGPQSPSTSQCLSPHFWGVGSAGVSLLLAANGKRGSETRPPRPYTCHLGFSSVTIAGGASCCDVRQQVTITISQRVGKSQTP